MFRQRNPTYKPKFKDFEILELIGEGSFGRVFKVKHKDSGGQVMAMKAMKKSQLIQNHQVKYAVSESNIMQKLNHPYLIKLYYSF